MYSKTAQLAKAKPKKKKIKSERKQLVVRLDQLIREIIKHRDNTCCSCGKQDGVYQVGHYIGRRHYSIRWDLQNVHAQCPGCNLYHNVNPAPYSAFMARTYGETIFDELQARKAIKMSLIRMRELETELKAYVH